MADAGGARHAPAMRALVSVLLILPCAACESPAEVATDAASAPDAAVDGGSFDSSVGIDAGRVTEEDDGGPGPVDAGAPSVSPIFQDGFESGDLEGAEGGRWYGGVRRRVSDERARTGTYALRFEYPGNEDLGGDSFSEVRASFAGNDAAEIWLEWYLFVPENYDHRDGDGADNNKFVIVGYDNKLHGSWQEPGGWTTRMEINPDDAEGALSRGRIVYGNEQTGVSSRFDLEHSAPSGVIREEDRGRWVRYGFHVRLAESIEARDGEVALYKDGVLMAENHGVPLAGFDFATPINCFELMGWANSGFTETTVFYVDDVRVYADDPGW